MSSVRVEELQSRPYVEVLCYPSGSPAEAAARIQELRALGIATARFEGPTKIGSLSVLGKGCVSVVLIGEKNGRQCAVKIRRLDANRPTLFAEAELQRQANRLGVGPRLDEVSANFLLMEHVQGPRIYDWLRLQEGRGSTARIRTTLRSLLAQCFALDRTALDHGELSNLAKHVLVPSHPVIIDFESASVARRPRNVTATAQALFLGGPWARRLRRRLRAQPPERIVAALRAYKRQPNEATHRAVLEVLGLAKQ